MSESTPHNHSFKQVTRHVAGAISARKLRLALKRAGLMLSGG